MYTLSFTVSPNISVRARTWKSKTRLKLGTSSTIQTRSWWTSKHWMKRINECGMRTSRCCHSLFKGVTMIVPQPGIWPLFRGVSSTFSAIFTPILHKTGTNWPLKNTPIFRIPSTLLLNHSYFRNFKYTFTKPPLFYKSFIYIFVLKSIFVFLKHITNKEKSSYGVNTQVGHTNH